MKRDDALQVILLSLTASGFGATFAALHNAGFKPEDVFAFSGAVVGAAGTIAGAAWVSDRSVNRDKRFEQTLIRSEFETLLDVANAAGRCYPDGAEWNDRWLSTVKALADVSGGTGRFLDEVIAYSKTLNFHQREAVRYSRDAITHFIQFYSDVFETEGDLDPMDQREWPAMINGVIQSSETALTTFRNI